MIIEKDWTEKDVFSPMNKKVSCAFYFGFKKSADVNKLYCISEFAKLVVFYASFACFAVLRMKKFINGTNIFFCTLGYKEFDFFLRK